MRPEIKQQQKKTKKNKTTKKTNKQKINIIYEETLFMNKKTTKNKYYL